MLRRSKGPGSPFGKTTTPEAGRQRPQRNTLSTLKEYPFKEITEKIIPCDLEIHSSLGLGLLAWIIYFSQRRQGAKFYFLIDYVNYIKLDLKLNLLL